MSAFSRFFVGSPARAHQLPLLTGSQQGLMDQLIGGIGSPLSSGLQNLQNILSGAPGAFEAFQRPAMRQFQEEVIPSISERFAAKGAGSSSGFNQTLARAGERLSESLAAQRAGLQSQALDQLQGLLGIGTQPQFGYSQTKGSQGALPSLLAILGAAATGGSPFGGMGGMSLGKGLTGLFRKNPNKLIDTYKMKNYGGIAAGPYSEGATYNPYTGVMG